VAFLHYRKASILPQDYYRLKPALSLTFNPWVTPFSTLLATPKRERDDGAGQNRNVRRRSEDERSGVFKATIRRSTFTASVFVDFLLFELVVFAET
jgi:hypothetical protein